MVKETDVYSELSSERKRLQEEVNFKNAQMAAILDIRESVSKGMDLGDTEIWEKTVRYSDRVEQKRIINPKQQNLNTTKRVNELDETKKED